MYSSPALLTGATLSNLLSELPPCWDYFYISLTLTSCSCVPFFLKIGPRMIWASLELLI